MVTCLSASCCSLTQTVDTPSSSTVYETSANPAVTATQLNENSKGSVCVVHWVSIDLTITAALNYGRVRDIVNDYEVHAYHYCQ